MSDHWIAVGALVIAFVAAFFTALQWASSYRAARAAEKTLDLQARTIEEQSGDTKAALELAKASAQAAERSAMAAEESVKAAKEIAEVAKISMGLQRAQIFIEARPGGGQMFLEHKGKQHRLFKIGLNIRNVGPLTAENVVIRSKAIWFNADVHKTTIQEDICFKEILAITKDDINTPEHNIYVAKHDFERYQSEKLSLYVKYTCFYSDRLGHYQDNWTYCCRENGIHFITSL
jgi:hypothetical protein